MTNQPTNQPTNQKLDANFHPVSRQDKFVKNFTYILWGIAGLSVLAVMILAGVDAFDQNKIVSALIYNLLVLLPLLVIGTLGTMQWRRGGQNGKTILFTWLILIGVWAITAWLCNYQSSDWGYYLADWCKHYRNLSFTAAMRQITTVSNYVPLYNYFLIFITRFLNLQGCLYAIKYFTFLFSVALAVVIELIICEIRHTKFSYLHLAIFLLLPPVLLEFTAWGQVDAIYTTFAMLAFYFALKHRSVWCFVCLGLAFAIKLQFLFIAPIIFVMLIIRDADGQKYLSWKWGWIAPLLYAVNLVPLCFGAQLWDLLTVYFRQTGYYDKLSFNCLNLPILFNFITNQFWVNLLTILFLLVGITVTILLLVAVLRAHRRQTLTTVDLVRYALCFALVMVYFMPKMHERFYFVAMLMGIIYALAQPSAWRKLLATMLVVSLTMSFFSYFLYPVYVNGHSELLIWLTLATILGWVLITLVVLALLVPVVQDEIYARKSATAAVQN